MPRERLKVDSGIAVASRVARNERLELYAKAIARKLNLKYVANVQFKLNAAGEPKLLEVNPRFPGTMPLTVKCGVNMPWLALQSALGKDIGAREIAWQELGMVRTWQEHFVESGEIADMEARAAAPRATSAPHIFTFQTSLRLELVAD